MRKSILTLAVVMHCLASAAAQEKEAKPLHESLESATLPKDYKADTKELKVGNKIVGNQILVTNPSQVSKVIVMIEFRDLSAVAARRASTKAYINALAQDLGQDGFKVVESKIPDISKGEFDKPISVDLVFANKDGKKIWTHQEIFFADKGFNIIVVADDADPLERLTKWAKTIKPKTKP